MTQLLQGLMQEIWNGLPRDEAGVVLLDEAHTYITRMANSAHHPRRNTVRILAASLGMPVQRTARLAQVTEQNVRTLTNFILQKISEGEEPSDLRSIAQPPPATSHEERIRLMQYCKAYARDHGLSDRSSDWYVQSTVGDLMEFKNFLESTASSAEEDEAPVDATGGGLSLDDVSTENVAPQLSFISESGYEVPVSMRSNPEYVTILMASSVRTPEQSNAAIGSSLLSKLVRGNGLNLRLPENGSPLPRGSRKGPLIMALYAHLFPYGHHVFCEDRLGLHDWATDHADSNGRDGERYHLPVQEAVAKLDSIAEQCAFEDWDDSGEVAEDSDCVVQEDIPEDVEEVTDTSSDSDTGSGVREIIGRVTSLMLEADNLSQQARTKRSEASELLLELQDLS